jgi:hypothetical protein
MLQLITSSWVRFWLVVNRTKIWVEKGELLGSSTASPNSLPQHYGPNQATLEHPSLLV